MANTSTKLQDWIVDQAATVGDLMSPTDRPVGTIGVVDGESIYIIDNGKQWARFDGGSGKDTITDRGEWNGDGAQNYVPFDRVTHLSTNYVLFGTLDAEHQKYSPDGEGVSISNLFWVSLGNYAPPVNSLVSFPAVEVEQCVMYVDGRQSKNAGEFAATTRNFGALSFPLLKDIKIANPKEGNVLTYSNGDWVNKTSPIALVENIQTISSTVEEIFNEQAPLPYIVQFSSSVVTKGLEIFTPVLSDNIFSFTAKIDGLVDITFNTNVTVTADEDLTFTILNDKTVEPINTQVTLSANETRTVSLYYPALEVKVGDSIKVELTSTNGAAQGPGTLRHSHLVFENTTATPENQKNTIYLTSNPTFSGSPSERVSTAYWKKSITAPVADAPQILMPMQESLGNCLFEGSIEVENRVLPVSFRIHIHKGVSFLVHSALPNFGNLTYDLVDVVTMGISVDNNRLLRIGLDNSGSPTNVQLIVNHIEGVSDVHLLFKITRF